MNFTNTITNLGNSLGAQYVMNATSNFVRRDALTVFATTKVALGVFLGLALVTGMAIYYCTKKPVATNENPAKKQTAPKQKEAAAAPKLTITPARKVSDRMRVRQVAQQHHSNKQALLSFARSLRQTHKQIGK